MTMKRLFILLLLLPFLGFGQPIQRFINPVLGGKPVWMLEQRTKTPSNKWMLFFSGSGELGPVDGSQKNDLLKYGYQKYKDFEPEWNVLAPQAVVSYSEFDKVILPWMVQQYGKDIEIIIVGHSLGARKVIEYATKYRGLEIIPQVVALVPVAGAISGSTPIWCATVDLPTQAVHGDADNAISWYQSKKFIEGENTCLTRKNKSVLNVQKGKGHTDIMNYVFQPSRDSEMYKYFRLRFTWNEIPPGPCNAIVDTVMNRVVIPREGNTPLIYKLCGPE
jgi:hypothetical protein